MEPPEDVRRGRPRAIAARALAALLALLWGWLFYGFQDFLTPLVEGPSFAVHYLMETGWGLTFLVLVGVPFVVVAVRVGSVVALQQVLVVAAALAIAAVLATSPLHLLVAVGLTLSVVVLVVVSRASLRVPVGRPAPVTGALSLVGLVAIAPYVWSMARGTDRPEETWGLDHYPVQAGFALAVVLVAALASVTTARCTPARWLPAATASAAAAWFGVLCLI